MPGRNVIGGGVAGNMVKKASIVAAPRNLLWLGFKLVVGLSLLLSIFAVWELNSDSDSDSGWDWDYPPTLRTYQRRSRSLDTTHFEGPPKIAFLFLARLDLPLDFLWGSFFEDADDGRFSIYVHSKPGFLFDESTCRSPFFYGRQLNDSIQVEWGKASMIQAERLLLDAALEDPANQRFVLLSDSCVPLYHFSYVYSYLMASPKSFVDSFLDIKEGRYNPKMSPKIPKAKWRKGSQWFTLVRSHAEVVVVDQVVFPLFRKFCKRRPELDESQGRKLNTKLQKQHNCIPDEHYVQTLLAMKDLDKELERRTVTYTVWDESVAKMEKKGWHPVMFSYSSANPKKMKEIKGINHVYYETEHRTEWCQTNSTLVPCFLFARKFSRAAAMRLLGEGMIKRDDSLPLFGSNG